MLMQEWIDVEGFVSQMLKHKPSGLRSVNGGYRIEGSAIEVVANVLI